jgi:hypothetical protein
MALSTCDQVERRRARLRAPPCFERSIERWLSEVRDGRLRLLNKIGGDGMTRAALRAPCVTAS